MSQGSLIPESHTVPSFPPIAYKGIPVLTTEMLAQAYEVAEHQIRQNFKNNRSRFVEGKHFFSISGQELKNFTLHVENFYSQISPKVRALTLWTERGAARHAKMLNSDRAWDVFELLEETFFTVKDTPALPPAGEKTTVDDRKPLKSLVSVWSRLTGIPDTDLWPQVRAQFGIFRIDQLRKGQLPAALAWVQAKSDALPAAAQKELPPAKDRYAELEDKFEAARQNLQSVQRELNRELGLLLGIGMGRIPGKVLVELPDMLWPAMERFLSGGADIHESWSINPVRLVKEIHRAFGVRV